MGLNNKTASKLMLEQVKTRAMVSGGGKKPWKQKGTGRARHGSIRFSPNKYPMPKHDRIGRSSIWWRRMLFFESNLARRGKSAARAQISASHDALPADPRSGDTVARRTDPSSAPSRSAARRRSRTLTSPSCRTQEI